jgi:hypothetical protein
MNTLYHSVCGRSATCPEWFLLQKALKRPCRQSGREVGENNSYATCKEHHSSPSSNCTCVREKPFMIVGARKSVACAGYWTLCACQVVVTCTAFRLLGPRPNVHTNRSHWGPVVTSHGLDGLRIQLVAERSKARVCGRPLAGVAGSNPLGGIGVRVVSTDKRQNAGQSR